MGCVLFEVGTGAVPFHFSLFVWFVFVPRFLWNVDGLYKNTWLEIPKDISVHNDTLTRYHFTSYSMQVTDSIDKGTINKWTSNNFNCNWR